jgi:hypothetical protein
MQIHEFCASSALMISQAAGRNACLPGWLRSRRRVADESRTQQMHCQQARVKKHRRPLTGSAAFDGGTRPAREPVPSGSVVAKGSFGCV